MASMELGSGHYRSSSQQLGPDGGADRISALPDDLLLLVLARIGCAATAARTSVLSRRWRGGLWTCLRDFVFRDVAFPSLEAALGRVSPTVSLLEIHAPVPDNQPGPPVEAAVNSLLRTTARLEPEALVFAIPPGLAHSFIRLDLPCFQRATSIVLDSSVCFLQLPDGIKFPAIETLSLSRCLIHLDTLLPCFPRLRVLRLKFNDIEFVDDTLMTLHSPSLQEFVVETNVVWTRTVNLVAPALKHLAMSLSSCKEASISISAPMLEKVLWQWCYRRGIIQFGRWSLQKLRLQTAERQGQLPSLHIHACYIRHIFRNEDNFAREVEKHMVADFSLLELHLITAGHVFGALIFHLFRINRISIAMQRLKIVMERSMVKEGCPRHCPCEPPNWRSQTISLTALEEVEINGFEGEYDEFRLLKQIFRCAPMLKRMILKLSQEASESYDTCTKIYNMFGAYSSVEWVNAQQPKLPVHMILILMSVASWYTSTRSSFSHADQLHYLVS